MATTPIPANFNEQYRRACDDEVRAMKALEACRKKRFNLEAMIPSIQAAGGSVAQRRAELPP